jgi:hypothetical protein
MPGQVARVPGRRGGRSLPVAELALRPIRLSRARSGAYSSAVEHLPYKEGVAGSIPAAPTDVDPPTPLGEQRELVLDVLAAMESDESACAATAHLLAVGTA